MDTTKHHGSPNLPDTSFGHETSDVDLTTVDRVGILSLVVIAVSAVAMWGLMQLLLGYERSKDPAPLPMAVQGDRQPPAPRLQLNEPLDLQTYRSTVDGQVNGYGWVDKANGVVRIPVSKAMELIAKRGFPPRDATLLQQLQAAQQPAAAAATPPKP